MEPTPHSASIAELVTGVVTDMRDLVGGHADAVADRLVDLRTVLTAIAIAAACAIVGMLLVLLASAATLVAVGLPSWAALWIVAVVAAAVTAVLVVRARSQRRVTDSSLRPGPQGAVHGNRQH